MAKRKQAKPTKSAPFCACGCGGKTGGGSFKQGHDQRLRGLLKRGEKLRAVTLAFLREQNKTSEWIKLRLKARPVAKSARRTSRKGRAETTRRPRPAAPAVQTAEAIREHANG